MGGFRARDADRERYVEVIETAYVDGQLGEQDRELRVSRALTAETLDELAALTRDLQNQPAPVVVRPAPVAPERPPGSAGSEGLPVKALGFVAAGIFLVAVLGLASSAQDDLSPFPDGSFSTTVPWDADYRLSASGVRTFVRRHDAKFGPDGAQQVTFFFDRVDAEIPVGGSDARVQEWSWDGVWRRIGEAKEVEGAAEVFDPAALDVKALFRNVDLATEGLGARGAEVQRIVVRPGNDGQGSVTIHVRDDRGGTARLETTLQGSRVREVPFEG